MSDALATFFGAWSETDAEARRVAIASAVSSSFIYSDPRSDGRLNTLDALADYVGNFATNAAGMEAGVIKTDSHNGYTRALVGFGMNGEWMQHGTYFAEMDAGGKIALLSGFVGTGAPE